jgi:hypothetical protein
MLSPMTARAERDEIVEPVRVSYRMVYRQPLGGAATDTAVPIAQPRRSPQLLPREAVQLSARRARAASGGAPTAAAARASGKQRAAGRACVGQDRLPFSHRWRTRRSAGWRGHPRANRHKESLCIGVDGIRRRAWVALLRRIQKPAGDDRRRVRPPGATGWLHRQRQPMTIESE